MRLKHIMLAAVIALPIPTGPGEAQEIGQPGRGFVSGPTAVRGMSCHPKRILAIPQRECASLPGHCFHPRHDRNRTIGRVQYVTSRDAQHHARGRRAGGHDCLYPEPQMSCVHLRSATVVALSVRGCCAAPVGLRCLIS